MSDEQWSRYQDHEAQVARLASIAKRRPLTQQEQERLMRELQMMRMTCDTNYILDPNDRACPKLAELAKILEECCENPEVKVLVFSEWVRMLELIREQCEQSGIAYALHTGDVPQRRRRAEIQLFKTNPECRVFLSTDSGSTGLNLQNASVVINCDLPWNPARLEQRIARAWRKHQTRAVTVIHLVSEDTIEHRMLSTLSSKRALADGVLDLRGDLSEIAYRGGRQAFLARLQQLVAPPRIATPPVPKPKPLPVDRALAFSQAARERLGSTLVRCEERYPLEGAHSVVVVVVTADAPLWKERLKPTYEELLAGTGSDPLAPVRLEVIDRATDEAIRRLTEQGLVAPATRAIRELFAAGAEQTGSLSEAERQKAAAHRQQASRKLKMAHLLNNGGLLEEEREALLQSALWLGRALAVENRSAEPNALDDAFRAPAALFWGDALPEIRAFASDPSLPAAPAAEILQRLLPAANP